MDKLKVRLVKVAVSIIAATGQHGIGDAVAEQGFQPDGKLQVIQIFQKAVASGAARLIQIIGQIVVRHGLADRFQHSRLISRLHLPKLRLLWAVSPRVGVRHVKDILEPCLKAGVVQ